MRKLSILLISVSLFLIPWVMLLHTTSFKTNASPERPLQKNGLRLYYAGPQGAVTTALLLAGFKLVDNPEEASVLFLNGVIPDAAALKANIERGAGLVLVLGPQLDSQQVADLLNTTLSLEIRQDTTSLVEAAGSSHPILKDIIWNSAPQVRERFSVLTPVSWLQPLIVSFENGNWILWSPSERIYVLNAFLDEHNTQFQEWAYFNYLIYNLVSRAAAQTPLSFAAYPASPVPHRQDQIILVTFMAGILFLACLVFWAVRRYSKAHPEALEALVSGRREFNTHEAGTDWEEIGFHRPLGGFMLAFMLGVILFIPLIIYQNLILPVYLLPSAQALGIWGRVTQFFNFLWVLLDMGTSAAFVKFFAQHRVHDPRKAIQYGQVYVWWQALSGAIQVAIIATVAGTVLPKTIYALYAWSVILHTFIQIPGFFQLMRFALRAWQRFDYAQIVDLGFGVIFPIITQPILVTLMVLWGRSHPILGGAMGGLLGLGMAAYAAEALTFLVGLWLYHRLGYNTRLLFMAHFDWDTVKTAFRFGIFEMAGSLAWAVGQALEILITQTRLVNYTEVWGNWGLAQNFIFAFNVISTLFDNLMPSISEAISHAKRKLSQYYEVMAYKWGGLLSAFIGAVLLAVADRFILGASGPEFVRAAAYSAPLIIWGAIQYLSWVGDNVQSGSNRPYLKTALVIVEQVIRIALALLLVRKLQITALILAYFIGLLTKGIVAYQLNHRICYPQRFYFWQSLAAPLLAGAAHYGVLRWITGLIWQQDQVTSIIIFLIGILFSYPLFAFFYGLFGGWDDATLGEVRHTVALSGFMSRMSWLFWAASALGARISPLHNRFPIDIRQAALEEARMLTQERVSL